MIPINLATWPRRSQYLFFRTYRNPHFSVTTNVDVTRLMGELRPKGTPVFNACLFAITGAANDVPEFRTRFNATQVFTCAEVGASVTVPIEDRKFAFCDVPWSPDWNTFNEACKQEIAAARQQTELKNKVAGDPNWIYMTCLPWVHMTAMVHPVSGQEDCIPRVAWGKIAQTNGRWQMPVAVQVHHALADGLHVGQFFEALQIRLNGL
ncbi:MAG: chloramphenicol acetyltransferase [Rhizobiaceae bacterium]